MRELVGKIGVWVIGFGGIGLWLVGIGLRVVVVV